MASDSSQPQVFSFLSNTYRGEIEIKTSKQRDASFIVPADAGNGKTVHLICEVRDSGAPALKSTPAPADTDHDGMPDDWETAKGLNPKNADDGNNVAADGYTMLENYLNSIEGNEDVESPSREVD